MERFGQLVVRSLVVAIAAGCADQQLAGNGHSPPTVLKQKWSCSPGGKVRVRTKGQPQAVHIEKEAAAPTESPEATQEKPDAESVPPVPQAAPSTSTAPSTSKVGQPSIHDLSDWIEEVQRQLELTRPDEVKTFLAACRDASARGNLEQVLAAWWAELQYVEGSLYRERPAETGTEVEPAASAPDAPSAETAFVASRSESYHEFRANDRRAMPARPDAELPDAAGPAPAQVHAPASPQVQYAQQPAENSAPQRPLEPSTPARMRYPQDFQEMADDSAERRPDEEALATRAGVGRAIRQEGSRADVGQAPVVPADEGRVEETTEGLLPDQASRALRRLARMFEESAAQSPTHELRNQVYSRFLYLMAADQEKALRPIAAVESADRDYWKNQVWVLHQYFDQEHIPRPETRANEVIDAMEEAIAALQQRADLEITTPILCRKVTSFGVYDEFPDYTFRAGTKVVIYWEVRNFTVHEIKDGYRTRMGAQFEISDEQGNIRHQSVHPFPDDVCRNRRLDFFMNVGLTLPADLSPGAYVLKVIVHDKTGDKVAEKVRRFVIR